MLPETAMASAILMPLRIFGKSCRLQKQGSRYPYRLKFRDPCFCNLQLFPKILSGIKIADAIAVSGSIDLVLGGIDR